MSQHTARAACASRKLLGKAGKLVARVGKGFSVSDRSIGDYLAKIRKNLSGSLRGGLPEMPRGWTDSYAQRAKVLVRSLKQIAAKLAKVIALRAKEAGREVVVAVGRAARETGRVAKKRRASGSARPPRGW